MTFSGGFGRVFRPVFDPGLTARNGLQNALIAYWSLNEAGGANNALDMHSNRLTLTEAYSPGANTGKVYATARTFNGVSNYFTRNSEALLQTGDVDFTIAAWVYRAGTPADVYTIVAKDNSSVREYFLYINSSNFGLFQVYRTGPTTKSANAGTVPLNTWTLLIGYHNATTDIVGAQLNNSSPVENATGGALQAATTLPLNVGFMTILLARYFNGRIGPVAMWKSAAGGGGCLSAAQRLALYNNGAGLAYANFTT